jgi:hypothetical protein
MACVFEACLSVIVDLIGMEVERAARAPFGRERHSGRKDSYHTGVPLADYWQRIGARANTDSL